MTQDQSDYDSPWKEALDLFFQPFMAFFFPQVDRDIDWSRNYESLDTELQEILRDAETGRRLADKLVKVWLKDGEEAFLLIHIEVQSQVHSDFAKRMYIYNHRLFDKYDCEVISFAVLGDERRSWRPTRYGYNRWGFQSQLQFPIVKLLDYEEDWQALEASRNPFAVIVMAHLRTLATRSKPQDRLQSKISIVRGLYERGYGRNEILQLFRLIEWMMVLPEELEISFETQLRQIEEENKMPYITPMERRATLRGREEGTLQATRQSILEVLDVRFGNVPETFRDRLEKLDNLESLQQLHRLSITIPAIAELEAMLPPEENQSGLTQ